MASKWKKRLKKIGKVAALAAAAYGASKLRGKAKDTVKNVHETGAIADTPGAKWHPGVGGKTHIPTPKTWKMPVDPHAYRWPANLKGGGIAKGGMGAAFKKGGRVKSMGIAKRGGGAAKR